MLNNIKGYRGIKVVSEHLFSENNLDMYYGLGDDLLKDVIRKELSYRAYNNLISIYKPDNTYDNVSTVNDYGYIVNIYCERKYILVLNYSDKIRFIDLSGIFERNYTGDSFNKLNLFVDILVSWCKANNLGLDDIYGILSTFVTKCYLDLKDINFITRNTQDEGMKILLYVKTRSKLHLSDSLLGYKCNYIELDSSLNKVLDINKSLYWIKNSNNNGDVYYINNETKDNIVVESRITNSNISNLGLITTVYLSANVGYFTTSLLGDILIVKGKCYFVYNGTTRTKYDLTRFLDRHSAVYTKGINGINIDEESLINKINVENIDYTINCRKDLVDYLLSIFGMEGIKVSEEVEQDVCLTNTYIIDWDKGKLYSYYDADVAVSILNCSVNSLNNITILTREGVNIVYKKLLINKLYMYDIVDKESIYVYDIKNNSMDYLGNLNDTEVQEELNKFRKSLCLGVLVKG